MVIRTAYDGLHADYISFSPAGSPDYLDTGWIRKDGEWKHVVRETYSLYEKIQAARDSVDLAKIFERYQNGDSSALNQIQGSYFNAVELPQSYSELFDVYQNCIDVFDRMPLEIREKYRNSPSYFWSKVGTKQLDDDINVVRNAIYKRNAMVDPSPSNTVAEVKDLGVSVAPISRPVVEPVKE